MHIKVNMVNSYTLIPITPQSTVLDILTFILNKNEIPLTYIKLCTLLEVRKDNYGYPLNHKAHVSNDPTSQYHFRVISIPISTPAEKLDTNLADIIYQQIARLIITKTWTIDNDTAVKITAFRCGIEFGKFNAEKHKELFLNNVIGQYLSADMVSNFKTKDLTKNILQNWSILSQKGLIGDRQQSIVNYINACQASIRQYGCATFLGQLKKVADEEADVFVYIGVNQHGVSIVNSDGNELTKIGFDELEIQIDMVQQKKVFIMSNNENGLVKYQIDMGGAKAMLEVVDYIKQISND